VIKITEISGENGAVYYNEELEDLATTGNLTFSTGKTITSSGNALNFETEGYVEGMLVTVSGCTTSAGNNGIFTVASVADGVMTVEEAVTAAAPENGAVKFIEAEPGIEVLGFYNWTLSYAGDALETTDFDDSSGGRSYIPGITSWTVTAEKHFLDDVRETEDWVGTAVEIRLYINYVITPSTGDPSQFWDGDTVVTGFDETTPVDALINQSITFQGDKALALRTQTKPWNEGIS